MSLGNSSLPGNYGIEDQLFAIKWVNENINYFNGDPNKITLTGESAGAASASLLAISDKAKGTVLSTKFVSLYRLSSHKEFVLK